MRRTGRQGRNCANCLPHIDFTIEQKHRIGVNPTHDTVPLSYEFCSLLSKSITVRAIASDSSAETTQPQ